MFKANYLGICIPPKNINNVSIYQSGEIAPPPREHMNHKYESDKHENTNSIASTNSNILNTDNITYLSQALVQSNPVDEMLPDIDIKIILRDVRAR